MLAGVSTILVSPCLNKDDELSHINTYSLEYDNCYNQGQHGTPKLSFDRYVCWLLERSAHGAT